MRKIIYTLVVACSVTMSSCQAQKTSNSTAGNYTYETECMGTEMDGSQTLKSWGNGRNYFDASTQAKKNAVRDVIFKGIHTGSGGCNTSAILLAPNAKSDNEDYFYAFFADGGEFTKYVSLKDEKLRNKIKRDKKKASESITRMVVVRIDRMALKQKLKQDKILK